MEELYNLGISEKTIYNMVEINPNIKDITKKEIEEKIQKIKNIKCYDNQILNIISSNALYLDKTNEEIIKLINYLLKIGFAPLNILFESNKILSGANPIY